MCGPDAEQRSPTVAECCGWGGTSWDSGTTWTLCRHRNTVGQMADSSGSQNVTRCPCNSHTPRPIQGRVCFSVSLDLSWAYVLLGSTGWVEKMLWSFFKKKKFIYLLIFGHAGSLLLCGLLSNCSELGLLSSCGVPPSLLWYLLLLWSTGSRPAGFSTCDSQALEATTGSAVVVHGVSCSVAGGIFPDLESNPCLVHWQVNSLPLNHQGSLDVVGLLGWSLQRSCSLHCPYGLYMHETRLSWLWNKAGCHGDSEDQALHVVWS